MIQSSIDMTSCHCNFRIPFRLIKGQDGPGHTRQFVCQRRNHHTIGSLRQQTRDQAGVLAASNDGPGSMHKQRSNISVATFSHTQLTNLHSGVHRMNCSLVKGAQVDSLPAVLCAAGRNIRWLLRLIARNGTPFQHTLFLRLLKRSGLAEMGCWVAVGMTKFGGKSCNGGLGGLTCLLRCG